MFISPAIDDWASIAAYDIDTVIDLDGGLDTCIPTAANCCLYLYFPIADDEEALPDLIKLRAIVTLGASPVRGGAPRPVALRDGLQPLGARGRPDPGRARHARGQRWWRVCPERRPGALFNQGFAGFVGSHVATDAVR